LADRLARRTGSPRPAELHAEIRDAYRRVWWRPTVTVLTFQQRPDSGLDTRYSVEFVTNQQLSVGDFERLFTLGVVALHRRRGERAPPQADPRFADDDAA
jgi:hypothetical protein